MSQSVTGSRSGRPSLLVALIILGLAIGASVFWWRGSRPAPPERPPQTVAATFLADLRSGRIDSAWEETTAEFKSFLGRERLRDFVRSHRALSAPLEFADAAQQDINGIPFTVCTFHWGQQPGLVRVLLAREVGQFKVERLLIQ